MAAAAKKGVKKLTRIGVVSAGINLGALYAFVGVAYALIFLVMEAAASVFAKSADSEPTGLALLGAGFAVMLVAFPVIFATMGFGAGALMALIYNFVVKYTGGIAFEMSG
ncbi:MAG: hypothetical protein WC861_06520 [Candidatus Micrarchaeia archaeon]